MNLRKQLKRLIFGRLGWFNYAGIKVYFPPQSGAFQAACEQGIYESENLQILAALIRPGTVYFDVGANIGLMAAPFLFHDADRRVVSFEPSPTALPYLRRTVRESGYGVRWQIVEKAVGASEGKTTFHVGAAGALYDGIKDTERAGNTTVRDATMTTLDVEWKRLNQPCVSVIKIDVEGGELDVLAGASECLRSQQPDILLEWNATNIIPYGRHALELLDYAATLNYRIFTVPDFMLVEDSSMLQLQMLRSENFLLRPKPPLPADKLRAHP
jgi:FkbM family methyltransferase